jgi:hypothetical protein
MSIGKITDRGLEVHFRKNDATILDSKGNVMLIANRVGDLYFVTRRVRDVIRSEGQRGNVGIVTSTVRPCEHERHFECRARAYRERSSSREPA